MANPSDETIKDFLSMLRRKVQVRKWTFEMYEKEGFNVDTGGVLRSQPFIDVKCKEANIDKDFYEY